MRNALSRFEGAAVHAENAGDVAEGEAEGFGAVVEVYAEVVLGQHPACRLPQHSPRRSLRHENDAE